MLLGSIFGQADGKNFGEAGQQIGTSRAFRHLRPMALVALLMTVCGTMLHGELNGRRCGELLVELSPPSNRVSLLPDPLHHARTFGFSATAARTSMPCRHGESMQHHHRRHLRRRPRPGPRRRGLLLACLLACLLASGRCRIARGERVTPPPSRDSVRSRGMLIPLSSLLLLQRKRRVARSSEHPSVCGFDSEREHV